MSKYSVKISKHGKGLTFDLVGPDLANANTDLLNECFGAFFDCAESNACFSKGLNANCLVTLVDHHKQADCITRAFGFAR